VSAPDRGGPPRSDHLPQDRAVNHDLLRLFEGIPWAAPGALLAVVAAAAVARPAGRRLGTSPALAWLLVASVLVIAAITLTPSADIADVQGCDLTVTRLTFGTLTTLNDRSLNVALFIPLGIAIGATTNRHRGTWLLLAILAPPAIEVYQLVAVPLSRTCQAIDVLDNWTGLVIGLAVGWVGAWLWRHRPGGA